MNRCIRPSEYLTLVVLGIALLMLILPISASAESNFSISTQDGGASAGIDSGIFSTFINTWEKGALSIGSILKTVTFNKNAPFRSTQVAASGAVTDPIPTFSCRGLSARGYNQAWIERAGIFAPTT
jgi:hypothetical protein